MRATDHISNDVPQAMMRRLVRFKLATANHVFNEGMVVGEAMQLLFPEQVTTAVADMDQVQLGTEVVCHRDGGAHARKFSVLRRLPAYLGIGLLQRPLE